MWGRPPALHNRPTAGACPAGGDTGSFWGCPTGQRVAGGDTARRCWGSPPAGPGPSLGAQLGGAVPLPCCPEARASLQAASPLPRACVVLASGSPLPPAGQAAHTILQTGGTIFLRLRKEALPRKAVLALSVGRPSLILLHRRSRAGDGGGCWRLTRAVASLPSADCARCSPGAADRRGHSSEEAPQGWALVSKRTSLKSCILGEDAAFRTGLLVSLLPQKGPSSKHRRWVQVPVCSWSCGFGRGQQGSASVAGKLSMAGRWP